MSDSLIVDIQEWRRRVLAGDSLSEEEMKKAVEHMRAGRPAASATSSAKRAATAPIDTAALIAQLKGGAV